jgi:hypothetical protein
MKAECEMRLKALLVLFKKMSKYAHIVLYTTTAEKPTPTTPSYLLIPPGAGFPQCSSPLLV